MNPGAVVRRRRRARSAARVLDEGDERADLRTDADGDVIDEGEIHEDAIREIEARGVAEDDVERGLIVDADEVVDLRAELRRKSDAAEVRRDRGDREDTAFELNAGPEASA